MGKTLTQTFGKIGVVTEESIVKKGLQMPPYRRSLLWMIWIVPLLLLSGCEFSFDFSEAGIGTITTCTELDDNMRCVDGTETTEFDGRAVMNASANDFLAAGDEVEVRWTTDNQEIERVQIQIEEDGFYPVGA